MCDRASDLLHDFVLLLAAGVSDHLANIADAHEVVVLQAELTAQREPERSGMSVARTGSRTR